MKLLIGLPVYNGAATLLPAIESLLAQDVGDLALVISDNGSTDATQEICRQAAARDPRVRLLREPVNQGPTWNFNRVLSFSVESEYYMWAARDDRWAPDYASSCIRFLQEHPEVGLCGTRVAFLNSEGHETGVIDEGCSSVGLSPIQRVLQFVRSLDLNSIFYGVYRSPALKGRELVNRIANDHAFLIELSLVTCLHTLPRIQMWRRAGGDSRDLSSLARALGVPLKYPGPLARFEQLTAPFEAISRTSLLTRSQRSFVKRALFGSVCRRFLRRRINRFMRKKPGAP